MTTLLLGPTKNLDRTQGERYGGEDPANPKIGDEPGVVQALSPGDFLRTVVRTTKPATTVGSLPTDKSHLGGTKKGVSRSPDVKPRRKLVLRHEDES